MKKQMSKRRMKRCMEYWKIKHTIIKEKYLALVATAPDVTDVELEKSDPELLKRLQNLYAELEIPQAMYRDYEYKIAKHDDKLDPVFQYAAGMLDEKPKEWIEMEERRNSPDFTPEEDTRTMDEILEECSLLNL